MQFFGALCLVAVLCSVLLVKGGEERDLDGGEGGGIGGEVCEG